jgi:uncharacterized membrane protein
MDILATANWGWVLTGLLLTLLGIALIWWSNQHNVSAELTDANREAAARALTKTGPAPDARDKAARKRANSARQDISRFIGVVGFLLLMSGLLLTALGVFAA